MTKSSLDILLNVINNNHKDVISRLDTLKTEVDRNTEFRHKGEAKFNEIDECIKGQIITVNNISKTLQQIATLKSQAEGSLWTLKNIWKLIAICGSSAIVGALVNALIKVYHIGY